MHISYVLSKDITVMNYARYVTDNLFLKASLRRTLNCTSRCVALLDLSHFLQGKRNLNLT